MGDFVIEVKCTGGHGCQREVKDGGTLAASCGQPGCPDCMARAFVAELKSSGTHIRDATLQHWPADQPGQTLGPRDDLQTGERRGSF